MGTLLLVSFRYSKGEIDWFIFCIFKESDKEWIAYSHTRDVTETQPALRVNTGMSLITSCHPSLLFIVPQRFYRSLYNHSFSLYPILPHFWSLVAKAGILLPLSSQLTTTITRVGLCIVPKWNPRHKLLDSEPSKFLSLLLLRSLFIHLSPCSPSHQFLQAGAIWILSSNELHTGNNLLTSLW